MAAKRTTAKTKIVKTPIKTGKTKQILERLRKICLLLPEANERVSHGEPTWFAGKGKCFAMLDDHHHGAEHVSVWLPLPPGAQGTLVASDPDQAGQLFEPAADKVYRHPTFYEIPDEVKHI